MLFPPHQSSIWRYGAKPWKRTRSVKFVRQKEQRRGTWLVPCVWALTFCNICKFIFKSSCQVPLPAVVCFAAQTARLAPAIVQDPGCRSGVDLDDLGAKKDYEEMLAKTWRLGTDEDALRWSSDWTRRPTFQSKDVRRLGSGQPCAVCQMDQFQVFCESLPRQILLLGLPVIPGASTGTRVLQFHKNSEAYHTSFNHQRSTKSPSQTQKCM